MSGAVLLLFPVTALLRFSISERAFAVLVVLLLETEFGIEVALILGEPESSESRLVIRGCSSVRPYQYQRL